MPQAATGLNLLIICRGMKSEAGSQLVTCGQRCEADADANAGRGQENFEKS